MMRSSDLLPIRTVHRAKGQLRLGFSYVASQPIVRDVLLAVAVVGTFAFNFSVTLPELSKVTFHATSASKFSLMLTAMGLGAVLGGLFVAHRSRPTVRLLAMLGVGFGVFMTATALSPSLWVAVALMVPTGAFSIAFVSTANATLQMHSREEMRGRVMSLYAIAFLGSTPVGALIIGAVIAMTNPRVGMLVGSLLTLATAAALLLRFWRVRPNN
jgi:predicted MFS family arabinose efflux permease